MSATYHLQLANLKHGIFRIRRYAGGAIVQRVITGLLLILLMLTGESQAQTCSSSIPPTTPTSRFTDNGDGTVTDSATGLMWKQCSEGQTTAGAGGCSGTASAFTWQQALQRAQQVNAGAAGQPLGYADWRVPNIKELISLVERACTSPAINIGLFPPVPTSEAFGFWSASPQADFLGAAWVMFIGLGESGYDNESVGNYVRLVRGGQSFSPPITSHFRLPTNLTDQTVNVSFPITIEALLSNGQRDTSFNGKVTLSTNYSSHKVLPSSIELINGVATVDVIIDSAGTGAKVIAMYGSLSGSSNAFDVVNSAAVPTTLFIQLVDQAGQPFISNSFLDLSDSANNFEHYENWPNNPGNGSYVYKNLDADHYTFQAISGVTGFASEKITIEIATGTSPQTQVETVRMRGTSKPPVLLVPGIMGSTIEGIGRYSNMNTYPVLSKNPPTPANELKIFNNFLWLADGGFDDIATELETDYTVYDVPWDWRVSLTCPEFTSCPNAWRLYLMKAIDDAKKDPEHDGIIKFQKVDIVAHSMGGLLVRAYIQSPDYRNDIDKFAMVGTPNEGSAKAYYMAEGGDPARADRIDGCTFPTDKLGMSCFYARSTDALYKAMNYGQTPFAQYENFLTVPPYYVITTNYAVVPDPSKLVQFYAENVPTARQLQATYSVLKTNSGTPQKLLAEPNKFLEALNSQNLTDYYINESDPNPDSRVRTKIFMSNNNLTLEIINVADPLMSYPEQYHPYKDGVPSGEAIMDYFGDGTVLACSAGLLGEPSCTTRLLFGDIQLNWATLHIDFLKGNDSEHLALMKAFSKEIHEFLNSGR